MNLHTDTPQDSDPLDLDALSLARALRRGVTTASHHTARALQRAHERGAQVGAFSSLAEELSHQQAQHADAALEKLHTQGTSNRQHNEKGPEVPLLAGVPLPIKDLVEIKGLPFEAGSPGLKGNVSTLTDGVAQDILGALTVPLGKTTTSEFGMSVFSESPTGAARTPWDIRRTSGGSSGGAGAAVASGIAPLAHGNDAGGSIRVPAACNGILGMVTGRGTVSSGPHGIDGPGLARHGILARTVADLAAGIDLIACSRPGDIYSGPKGAYEPHALDAVYGALTQLENRNVQPRTIGIITTPMVADTSIHPEALNAVERARAALEALGHRVIDAPVPMGPAEWRSFMPVWAVGAASIPLPFGTPGDDGTAAAEEAAGIGSLTRWLREMGAQVSGREYASALSKIQQLTRRMALAWEGIDAILTPLLSRPPVFPSEIPLDPREDFDFQSRFTPWTSVWNMNGFAAMSVPIHRAVVSDNEHENMSNAADIRVELPFSVHLAGTRLGAEGLLLGLAAQLEIVDPWPNAPIVPRSGTLQ